MPISKSKTATLVPKFLPPWEGRGWGEAKVPPFLGAPPFLWSPPQDNFSLQNANWRPPKYKLSRGYFCVFLYKNCRLEVANPFLEGVNLHFEGCQFTFWRPKLSWGCFIEKGRSPKRVVLWVPARGIHYKTRYLEASYQRCWNRSRPPKNTQNTHVEIM